MPMFYLIILLHINLNILSDICVTEVCHLIVSSENEVSKIMMYSFFKTKLLMFFYNLYNEQEQKNGKYKTMMNNYKSKRVKKGKFIEEIIRDFISELFEQFINLNIKKLLKVKEELTVIVLDNINYNNEFFYTLISDEKSVDGDCNAKIFFESTKYKIYICDVILNSLIKTCNQYPNYMIYLIKCFILSNMSNSNVLKCIIYDFIEYTNDYKLNKCAKDEKKILYDKTRKNNFIFTIQLELIVADFVYKQVIYFDDQLDIKIYLFFVFTKTVKYVDNFVFLILRELTNRKGKTSFSLNFVVMFNMGLFKDIIFDFFSTRFLNYTTNEIIMECLTKQCKCFFNTLTIFFASLDKDKIKIIFHIEEISQIIDENILTKVNTFYQNYHQLIQEVLLKNRHCIQKKGLLYASNSTTLNNLSTNNCIFLADNKIGNDSKTKISDEARKNSLFYFVNLQSLLNKKRLQRINFFLRNLKEGLKAKLQAKKGNIKIETEINNLFRYTLFLRKPDLYYENLEIIITNVPKCFFIIANIHCSLEKKKVFTYINIFYENKSFAKGMIEDNIFKYCKIASYNDENHVYVFNFIKKLMDVSEEKEIKCAEIVRKSCKFCTYNSLVKFEQDLILDVKKLIFNKNIKILKHNIELFKYFEQKIIYRSYNKLKSEIRKNTTKGKFYFIITFHFRLKLFI